MWCYQKPGFEGLLLAELQRQQQFSQFCDTLLKAEGVSVPAHSCILSAISPHFSSALSSSPLPPAGQSRLLEFQAMGACTLLRIIRLLYSGEMTGEGENEKQQAIHAAAKLGIDGLVEVKIGKSKGGGGVTGVQYREVGVQTEDNKEGHSRWKREVRDGSTYLWKETLSGGKDIWTQTEEIPVNSAPPAPPAASFETIDMSAFQSLGQTDSQQFVPITLVYPSKENQTIQVCSDASACVLETAGCTSVALVTPPCPFMPPSLPLFSRQAEPQSCWAGPQGAAGGEEWEDGQIEQFEGNIAGFINYFLNTKKTEGTRGRRAGRRPRGARGAGTCQQRARRPRGRPAGRGRGGFTQKVGVQEVGLGKLQKQFLHRWGTRTGQGGGAVGRKLFLKDRDVPLPARRGLRARGRGKVTDVSQSRYTGQFGERWGGNSQQGQRTPPKQFHQDSLAVGGDRCSRGESTPVSFPAPSKQIHSGPTLSASSLSWSHTLGSPAASCMSATSSALCPTQLPPPASPPHLDQQEHIDHLLEEVMMGLDILPKNNRSGSAGSECDLPGSGVTLSSSGDTQNKDQGQMTDTEVPVLQQQCEGELNEMLETFLQSFEQHAESCNAREGNETDDGRSSGTRQPYVILSKLKTPHILHLQNKNISRDANHSEASEPQSEASESHKASTDCAASPERTEKSTRAKWSKKRKTRPFLFSLENKMKKSVSSRKGKVTDQQIPVTEPERNGLLLGQNSLQYKSSSKTKTRALTSKHSPNGASGNDNQEYRITKTYPIRSRLREARFTDIKAFLENPLSAYRSTGRRHCRPGTKKQLFVSSEGESAATPVHPQPADSCCVDHRSETNQDGNEDLTAQPQEEAEGRIGSGTKRSNEDTSEEAAVNKRINFDRGATCETVVPSSGPAEIVPSTEQEEVIDVEAVSLTGLRSCFLGAKQEGERFMEATFTGEEVESSDDEVIDVEGDKEDSKTTDHSCLSCSDLVSPSHLTGGTRREGTGNNEEDLDEDVDVIGASSPAPDPIIINWTVSSEDEDGGEEVDVDGETIDCISFILTAVKKSELDCRQRQTEELSG